jgi:hypothetical protein
MSEIEVSLPEEVVYEAIPLAYNKDVNTSSITNIMLVDYSIVEAQMFYDSANSNTFPILYSYTSEKTELLSVLREKFKQGIKRIAFVFHDPSVLKKTFLDKTVFFNDSDLELNQTTFSENVSFFKDLADEFSIENYDFLACNTLQYPIWKQYYELLHRLTNVKCGASNDATGNIQYGADWVMENTNENIRNIYFSNSINNYASTLAATTISSNGGTVNIKFASSQLQYNINGGSYTNIGTNYPINIVNGSLTNILTVKFENNLTINASGAYFVCGSSFITFDGANSGLSKGTVTVSNVTNYLGLIQNGTSAINGFHTITVKNIQTTGTVSSSLATDGGWLCQSYFGRNISGVDPSTNLIVIDNCSNGINVSGTNSGGICGFSTGFNGIVTISNCSNTGQISGASAGGMCGSSAGFSSGTITISNCSNTGQISGVSAGGICGPSAGNTNGTVTITSCSNTGDITNNFAGGICGSGAGNTNGTVTISSCWNTGLISGNFCGGITGDWFGVNTNKLCSVTNSYSISNITGSNAGGISGADVGYNNNAVYASTKINITNCYTLGSIGPTCGGILGGTEGSTYTTVPIVTLENCYSNGAVANPGSGLIANSLPIPVIKLNCYIGNNMWNDDGAKAFLSGTPTNTNTNNPGSTWTSLSTNTPYVLSSFNSQLYNPNSMVVNTNTYSTSEGLFQPGFTYSIVNSDVKNYVVQTINPLNGELSYSRLQYPKFPTTAITNVVASKYNGNRPYNYNINSFTLTYSICFKEDSLILCLINNEEKYVKVQELRPNMLVKTYEEGYVAIDTIGWFNLDNSNIIEDDRHPNGLYELSKEMYPDLLENLVMTGRHCILVDDLGKEELCQQNFSKNVMIQDKYKLPCVANKNAIRYNQNGIFKIWSFCLEAEDNKKNYGIYVNGLLVESTSKNVIETSEISRV